MRATSETLHILTVLTYTYFRLTNILAQEGRDKQICKLDESSGRLWRMNCLEKFHVQLEYKRGGYRRVEQMTWETNLLF
jgi:hypothetical protein